MNINWSRVGKIVAGILAVYFLIFRPVQAADAVNNGLGFLENAANSVVTFVENVIP